MHCVPSAFLSAKQRWRRKRQGKQATNTIFFVNRHVKITKTIVSSPVRPIVWIIDHIFVHFAHFNVTIAWQAGVTPSRPGASVSVS